MTDTVSDIEEILVLHHSHLDVGYTHSQPILWRLQSEYLSQAMDWLEQTADLPEDCRPKWTCEATEPVRRWLADAAPEQVVRFKELCDQGRIGLSALRWHVSATIDRPGLRRLVAGKPELEDAVGRAIKVACQHDVNGVPWPIADELLDAGVDLFVTAVNRHLGAPVAPRPGVFDWQAPSGRTLRVFNGSHYTMFDQLLNAWDDSVDRMVEGWNAFHARLRSSGYRLPFVYLTSTCSPIMWDNAPPNPFLPDLIRRWNEEGRGPRIRYATFDDLRERVMRIPEEDVVTLRGDWTDYWSFGVGSAPAATAVNQRSKPLLAAAATIGADASLVAEAADRVDLFDEHTWSHWNSDPANEQARAIETMKQAGAHEGHELAAFAVMDGLERLARNPVADKGIAGVLLVNTADHPRTVTPDLPASWFASTTPATERTYRASRMAYENRPWRTPAPDEARRRFGRVDLAPRSWRIIGVGDLPEPVFAQQPTHEIVHQRNAARELNFAAAVDRVAAFGHIESPFHHLTYDAASGRITSLVDRATGREILRPRPGMDLLSFIRERPDALVEDSRRAFYQRNLDREMLDESCWEPWTPVHTPAERVLHHAIEESPGRVTLVRRFAAPGVRSLIQRIGFDATDPVIHITIDIDLAGDASPTGIYLALPLALEEGWHATFDTAGHRVHLDDDQLPGASRGWVTTESSATMWDESGAVTLLTPDAPLIQFGDFHFGPPPNAIPRDQNPLLLSWIANNYWDTNFPQVQNGPLALRYGLLTLPTPNPHPITKQADLFRTPPLTWPVTTGGRPASEGTL
ncbi:glycoside hydrolase family 38 [Catenulispora acidiphila DSM 44928]|uniref:Glycoside hydrolase family 38 n=1 Tax=Catenulispora acidiphila (strain DSM 44928 / JCM 14897 / NBRC 102108 / NRRL B-24433 / ID139908) TaxID=479433 RepID=C7Q4T6_CATAD|nr:glycoside hydrolase [Catenulispora acidiphila]ACU73884.1 glycoside hydrolase family 38 [Catenulispora acidiphila DSM 44928]